MPVTFDHVAIPTRNAEATASFLADILALPVERDGQDDELYCLRLSDRVQLLFQETTRVEPHHMAFRVDERELREVIDRLRKKSIPYGNDPEAPDNGHTTDPLGGKGRVYFKAPDGHLFEVCA
jgi:catechol 2,3-dioxygenase-like lactoylglutathione lyase family enzyme